MHPLLVVLVLAACSGAPPRFSGGILAPIEIRGERLLVTALIDGKPRVMVLDTAASITAISTRAARELGIEVIAETTINGHIPAQVGLIKSLSIGLANHRNVEVAIVDLPNARDSSVPFDGVLGLDILARHDVVLDFRNRTIALYPSGAIVENALLPGMARVALQRDSRGLMRLDVKIGDHPPMRALLDLGAPITVINHAAAKVLGVSRPMFQVPSMTVGNVQLARRTMLVRELPVFERAGLVDQPAILLGSDVFKDRALAIGYRDRMAMLSH
ncbi:MAG: aspartyl protease family protein [Deltaproteobacteria bacterium]|nr:aspartyl protease family protein [Deltaproteobacteria bacterium]